MHDGRLYLVNDNEAQSFIATYDAATGAELWRTDRDEQSNWATPFVWANDVLTDIVTSGTGGIRSYGLTGELLWQLTRMLSLVIPTPFAKHGLLYINSGYVADSTQPVYAIRPGADGDITLGEGSTSNDYIVWSHPQLGSHNPSSIVYGDYHYTLLDRGLLLCYDARNRPGSLSPATHHGRHPAHKLAMGVQRQNLRAQRGRRHVRHQGGAGVRSAWPELAGRDGACHASGGERERATAHSVEAVPHREGRRSLTR